MVTTLPFQDVVMMATRNSDSINEIIVPMHEVTVTETGANFGNNWLPFEDGDNTLCHILDSAGAPTQYLRNKMPAGIRVDIVNEHVRLRDYGQVVGAAIRNGRLITFFRADFIRLSTIETLTAIAEGIGTGAAFLSVAKVEIGVERIEIELVTPDRSVEVRPGDVVYGGIQIVHYPLGQQASVIQTFMQRLVCSNGLTRRECAARDGISRTRKLRLGHHDGKELQLDQVRRLAKRSWDALEPQLEELKNAPGRPVEVEPFLSSWLRHARMSDRRLMPRLLAAWREEGSELNEFGLVNAMSRVASHHHDLTPRERRLLAALSGVLAFRHVYLPPLLHRLVGCWRAIMKKTCD